MSNITIPAGKELRLFKQGSPLVSTVKIYIAEELTISLSSTFGPLMGGGSTNKLFSILGTIMRDVTGFGFSGQFKQMGFQIWEGTDPLSMSCTVRFDMGSANLYNAYQEVYLPTMILAKLPLPDDGNLKNGVGLIAPGPSILSAFGSTQSYAASNIISLEVGNILRIPQVIIRKAEPTFSDMTDENGYPIWSKIQLDIVSVFTATTSMLDINQSQFDASVKKAQTSKTVNLKVDSQGNPIP